MHPVTNLLSVLYLLHFGGSPVVGVFRQAPTHPQPQITLTRYREVDSFRTVATANQFPTGESLFGNDFVARNGSDYIIYEGTRSVTFSCEADYPIAWNSPFSSRDPDEIRVSISEFRISLLTPKMETPENTRYITLLSISPDQKKFFSSELTCESIEMATALKTSIFVYKMGTETLENEGKTMTVYAAPLEPESKYIPPLVIPCRPSSFKLKISLQKKISVSSQPQPNNTDTLWSPVKLSGSEITFDPKIGFTLQRNYLRNSVYGLYRCFVADRDDDYADESDLAPIKEQMVLVNVLKPTATPTNIFVETTYQEKLVVSDPANFEAAYDQEATIATVKCCTGRENKPPNLFLRDCFNAIQCKWMRQAILKDSPMKCATSQNLRSRWHRHDAKVTSDCCDALVLGTGVVVKCTGENVDVLQEYATLFHPDAGGPVANRSQRLPPAQRGHSDYGEYIRLFDNQLSASKTVEVSRKAIILVGHRVEAQSVDKTVREVNHLISSPNLPFTLYGDQDASTSLRRKLSYIYEYERDVYYAGEPLTIMCLSIQHFYSFGVIVRLIWKNGTESVISPSISARRDRKTFQVYLSNNALLPFGTGGSEGIAEDPVIAEEDMESVDCFMPVSGSSRWDKISKKIKVLAGVVPKFAEAEQEDVYFYVGDVNRTVPCTIKEGMPLPEMTIYRDGRPFFTTKNLGRNGTRRTDIEDETDTERHVDIRIDVVEHNHQLVLLCRAGNIKGTATRTVRVFVLDKPSRTLPITLGILGVLGLTLVALGVKLRMSKGRGA